MRGRRREEAVFSGNAFVQAPSSLVLERAAARHRIERGSACS